MPEQQPAADVPEAQPESNPDERASMALPIGPPFAMSDECELRQDACWAVVQCDCGQPFKINLLRAGPKPCPKCGTEYTHVLVVTTMSDTEMAEDMFAQILVNNGVVIPEEEGDDEGDDEGGPGDDDADDVPEAEGGKREG